MRGTKNQRRTRDTVGGKPSSLWRELGDCDCQAPAPFLKKCLAVLSELLPYGSVSEGMNLCRPAKQHILSLSLSLTHTHAHTHTHTLYIDHTNYTRAERMGGSMEPSVSKGERCQHSSYPWGHLRFWSSETRSFRIFMVSLTSQTSFPLLQLEEVTTGAFVLKLNDLSHYIISQTNGSQRHSLSFMGWFSSPDNKQLRQLMPEKETEGFHDS